MHPLYEKLVEKLRQFPAKVSSFSTPNHHSLEVVFHVGDMREEETYAAESSIRDAFEFAHGIMSKGHLEVQVRPSKGLFELSAIGHSNKGVELVRFLHDRLKER
jgi:hypothetical protein